MHCQKIESRVKYTYFRLTAPQHMPIRAAATTRHMLISQLNKIHATSVHKSIRKTGNIIIQHNKIWFRHFSQSETRFGSGSSGERIFKLQSLGFQFLFCDNSFERLCPLKACRRLFLRNSPPPSILRRIYMIFRFLIKSKTRKLARSWVHHVSARDAWMDPFSNKKGSLKQAPRIR